MQSGLFGGSCRGRSQVSYLLLNSATAYMSRERLQLQSFARVVCTSCYVGVPIPLKQRGAGQIFPVVKCRNVAIWCGLRPITLPRNVVFYDIVDPVSRTASVLALRVANTGLIITGAIMCVCGTVVCKSVTCMLCCEIGFLHGRLYFVSVLFPVLRKVAKRIPF